MACTLDQNASPAELRFFKNGRQVIPADKHQAIYLGM